MATEITWQIANLERNTADGVVFTVHYTVSATDGSNTVGSYGSVGLEEPDPETMIAYEELTPELVIDWTKARLGEEQVQSIADALQQQLDEQSAPTKAAGVPW